MSTNTVEVHTSPAHAHSTKQSMSVLMLSALGIVFGDIGTSPLYTFRECLKAGGALTHDSILGILSLILWSVFVVVTLKYVFFVMRADNNGEGGILALMALVSSTVTKTMRYSITLLGLVGAAMFYGDSMITPAISVLSAVEGLALIDPRASTFVIPIALGILIALFAIQKNGTSKIGTLFGPAMLLWFTVLAALGLWQIVGHPSVLAAISPHYAVMFVVNAPAISFAVLASVFLALTGGEALFADMGHFGKAPIQRAWLYAVFPALILNYFGQGALVLSNPAAAKNPFFLMAPTWALVPLVLLATVATVVASQAVITGAFSMTKQGIQLGYLPRIIVVQTSRKEIGQIYVPFINGMLFVCVLFLVLFFRSSENLAAAYGIAVASTMLFTTVFMFLVSRLIWKWSLAKSLSVTGMLVAVDLVFVATNLGKVAEGGWFPLVIGAIIFTLMTTWKRGRRIVYDRVKSNDLVLTSFIENLLGAVKPVRRVSGTAVYMNRVEDAVPSSFTHNLKHNKVIHKTNLFLVVSIQKVPFVDNKHKITVTELGHGCYSVIASLGFKETPNVPKLLYLAGRKVPGWSYEQMDTSFFLTRQTIVARGNNGGMALWREKLFVLMSRNAAKAADYFCIPANQVVEIGSQVDI